MKQAILVIAHKNCKQLKHLIKYFNKDCHVYIHIDKKSSISGDKMLALKEEYPQIKGIYQKFDVHWGGFSLLQVEMFLLEIAMRDSDADSFHLISGQDYPIVPLTRFLQFFAEAKNLNFIDYCKWPITSWEHPFFDRFRFFYLCDYIEGNSAKGKEFLAKSIHWQKTYGIKREPITEFNIICKGSQWFSLTRQAVTILLDYTYKKKSLYNRLNYTFAPEETYINTVLVNIMDKNLIQNNNLNQMIVLLILVRRIQAILLPAMVSLCIKTEHPFIVMKQLLDYVVVVNGSEAM